MIAAPLGAVTHLDLWGYRVPLKNPLRLGRRTIDERNGLLLEWQQAEGRVVWSEIAPLPEFSRESLQDCIRQCKGFFANPGFEDVDGLLAAVSNALAPAVRFGLESGCLQLSLPLPSPPPIRSCRLLDPDAPIPPDAATATCVKFKVGRGDLETDLDRIRRLLDAMEPRARLRLDANRSWSLEQATELCAAIDARRIDYLEEPLRPGLSYAGWADRTRIPFAWDETLRQDSLPDLDTPGLGALVLKPMLAGLAKTRDLVDQARVRGIRAVLSGAYESNLSLDFYACLATFWGLEGPHGLDTFRPFSMALLQPPRYLEDPVVRPVLGRDGLEHLDRLL
ncbi:o-succinylbenzoate synthase [Thioalkalivibrio sp.]|uniref:o-succinylbenzoate synthase n=1 Tax=Thioalkalivibrio sp. TaxID=2093813 RepID=UPI0012D54E19|nr:o-succinylbenzoate synthase [Thioalkalivibrio sp.]TVP78912.1 MAG: o-succinylbenzoate synthase [Thioalkalivibrio sp.]